MKLGVYDFDRRNLSLAFNYFTGKKQRAKAESTYDYCIIKLLRRFKLGSFMEQYIWMIFYSQDV